MSRFIPFIVGVVLTALVAHRLHEDAVGPTIDRVADAAIRPVETPAAPFGLSRPLGRGWRVVGGREDRLGGRSFASVTYRRGTRTLTLSRMADTDGLGAVFGRDRKWGRLIVTLTERGGQLRGHTVVDDHHLVLTATPASAAMRRELMRLAVAAGGQV